MYRDLQIWLQKRQLWIDNIDMYLMLPREGV